MIYQFYLWDASQTGVNSVQLLSNKMKSEGVNIFTPALKGDLMCVAILFCLIRPSQEVGE